MTPHAQLQRYSILLLPYPEAIWSTGMNVAHQPVNHPCKLLCSCLVMCKPQWRVSYTKHPTRTVCCRLIYMHTAMIGHKSLVGAKHVHFWKPQPGAVDCYISNPETLQSLPQMLLALWPLFVACTRDEQKCTLPLCKQSSCCLV